jgi:rhodanese-related sulfurtransferase
MPLSGSDLITAAKSRITEVDVADVQTMAADGKPLVVLDVREPNETNLGRARGAVVIPRGLLEGSIEAAIPRDARVVIVCASGNRSALAADTMQQMGYSDVASLRGGFKAWYAAGLPVES